MLLDDELFAALLVERPQREVSLQLKRLQALIAERDLLRARDLMSNCLSDTKHIDYIQVNLWKLLKRMPF